MLARNRVSRDGTDVAASRASQTSVELVSPRPHRGNRGSPLGVTHPRRTAGHSAAGSCTYTPRGLSRSWRETDGTACPPRPHISESRESKNPADALGAVLRACVSGRDMGRPMSLAFVLGDSGGPFSPPVGSNRGVGACLKSGRAGVRNRRQSGREKWQNAKRACVELSGRTDICLARKLHGGTPGGPWGRSSRGARGPVIPWGCRDCWPVGLVG